MDREISKFGVCLTALALVAFTGLSYGVVGLWCILAGPLITIMACRPARVDGPWLWESSDSIRKDKVRLTFKDGRLVAYFIPDHIANDRIKMGMVKQELACLEIKTNGRAPFEFGISH